MVFSKPPSAAAQKPSTRTLWCIIMKKNNYRQILIFSICLSLISCGSDINYNKIKEYFKPKKNSISYFIPKCDYSVNADSVKIIENVEIKKNTFIYSLDLFESILTIKFNPYSIEVSKDSCSSFSIFERQKY